jgi:hypothetical protein
VGGTRHCVDDDIVEFLQRGLPALADADVEACIHKLDFGATACELTAPPVTKFALCWVPDPDPSKIRSTAVLSP